MKQSNCALCAKPFRYRSNKRYCSDKCRFQAWIQGKTEPDIPMCHYCGMPADTIDHVPPRSVRSVIIEHDVTRWPFKEVNCCRECNSLLGAEPPWTVSGRKKAIKEKLKRRYKKYLNIPNWDDSDLGRLGRTLESHVHEGLVLQEAIKMRIKW